MCGGGGGGLGSCAKSTLGYVKFVALLKVYKNDGQIELIFSFGKFAITHSKSTIYRINTRRLVLSKKMVFLRWIVSKVVRSTRSEMVSFASCNETVRCQADVHALALRQRKLYAK